MPFLITKRAGPWCSVQASTMTFFQLSGVLWTAAIAHFMYNVTVLRMEVSAAGVIWRYCVVIYGCSLLAAVLPFTTDSYGDTGSWCWITEPSKSLAEGLALSIGIWWRMICFYLPLWLCFGYILHTYYSIAKKLNNYVQNSTSAEAAFRTGCEGILRKLKYYPFVLAFCYFPATVLRLYNIVTGSSNYYLQVYTGAAGNLIGILDCIVDFLHMICGKPNFCPLEGHIFLVVVILKAQIIH